MFHFWLLLMLELNQRGNSVACMDCEIVTRMNTSFMKEN
jgi:hypothetical protein